MAKVRQSGTNAERSVRAILRSLRVRYQTQSDRLPGRPDMFDRELEWAIFVNGCFWHAHKGCKLWKIPKSNRAFWKEKFEQNRRRDRRQIRDLKKLGFTVLIIWQCELDQEDKVRREILRFVERAGSQHSSVTELTNGVREEYKCAGHTVSRAVILPNSRTITTRIHAQANNVSPRSAFDFAYLRKSTRPAMPPKGEVVRVADIFSGCGGLSLGTMEACRALGRRFAPILALDRDESCVAVYRRNFHCKRVYQNDITQVLDGRLGSKSTQNERQFLKGVGKVTLLLAGPPCQGNSDLNNHTRRDDPRNALYERVARFVELARPEHVLIENVPSAIHGKERAVQKSLAAMRRLGYHVDSETVELSSMGLPQKRKRHVVIASMSKKVKIADIIERSKTPYAYSVRWAIGDLKHERSIDIFTSPSRHTARNQNRIRFLHENDVYELPNRLRPPCHRNGGHSYKSMYGRLKLDEPAQTVTSGFGSPGQGRFVHPTQIRTLTPHEAARLQFFPNFFDFSPAKNRASLASMIGNAAPMKLSYVFGLELLS